MNSLIFNFIPVLTLVVSQVKVVIMSDLSSAEIESVLHVIIAENQDLKFRLEKLENARVDDQLKIERLESRIIALETNAETVMPDRFPKETGSKIESKNFISADEANNYQDFSNDSNVEFDSPRSVAGHTSPLTGLLTRRGAGTEVAFHVYLSGSRCYSNHEIFKFDREAVDVGSGYNINDGIFDAPATGLYVFTWTVAATQGSWYTAELVIDGAVKGWIITDSDTAGTGNGVHPATGIVLANVNAGDHVFIRYLTGSNCHVESDFKTRTTFSGWLL